MAYDKNTMTRKEIERQYNPNYPFVRELVFCDQHTADSNIVEVCECNMCYKVPFGASDKPAHQATVLKSSKDIRKHREARVSQDGGSR